MKEEKEMKYFEFLEPYYALIKAKDENEAAKKYVAEVAGDDNDIEVLAEECNVVPEHYATFRFGQVRDENQKLMEWQEAKEYLESGNAEVLLMDGSLI